jgi:hypothetical protein
MGLGTVVAAAAGPDDEMVSDAKFYWRLLRGTAVGTFEVAKAVAIEARFTYGVMSTKAKTAVAHYRAERKWSMDDQPDKAEVPWKRRTPVWKRATGATFLCLSCRRKWTSAAALNDHQDRVHGQESPAWEEAHARASRAVRRGATTKRRMRGARPAAVPAAASAAAVQEAKTRIGAKAVSDNAALATMRQGWAQFGDSRPQTLSQIRADMLGMEQVLGAFAAEAIVNYRRRLLAMGFDPALLMNLGRAENGVHELARNFSGTIAVIDEALKDDIAAAKKAQGKAKPSVDVLAN